MPGAEKIYFRFKGTVKSTRPGLQGGEYGQVIGVKLVKAWRKNIRNLTLIDKPDCGIRVGQEQYRATARTTQGNERAELWEKLAELYPPYNDYQAATDRKIPVVMLGTDEKIS